MKILVGHTGFVGSNLKAQTTFDRLYNSGNITDAFGTNPDLLVYSGVRSEKFLANSDPEKDFEILQQALDNIRKINPKKVILISTVDVYPEPIGVDENKNLADKDNQAYGKNRFWLEQQVESEFQDHLILRLPALFGPGLKKNFIYDLIHIIPAMLSAAKFAELSANENWLTDHYTQQPNGFYKLNPVDDATKADLKKRFLNLGFTALHFTDSRGVFQFYNLNDLWADIEIATKHGIRKLNLATEPVSVDEIYRSVFGKSFSNEILPAPPRYDFYTLHAALFSDQPHYMRAKGAILEGIVQFIQSQQ